MDRREIAFAAPRRRDAAHAADRDRARRRCPAPDSAESTASSATQWLPAITRSGARACPISVTFACVPASTALRSASTSRKPSACEKVVTEPEPLASGNAIVPVLARHQRDQHEFLAADLGGNAHRHGRVDRHGRFRRQAGLGADHRRDEGVEREDRRGRKARQHHDRLALPTTARQSGLPGLSATPCTITPGSPSRDTTRCERSPAPFEVPPDSTTMSQVSSALRTAASSASSSSGNAPNATGSPPASRTAAAMIAPLRVVDRAGPQRAPERRQFVAGREHRDFRPPHHVDLREAARRQHADLARGDRARRAAAAFRRARCRSPHRR